MKRFEFWLSVVCSLAASVASAATGSSPEFKLDLRGLGPWQRHTAATSEALTYSSAWATNAASGAKAVVKVMPVLKTKPKYLVIDLSGGTNATQYGISYLDEVPSGTWSDEYKTSKLVLRHIPAGSFIMGGRATDYPGAVNRDLHMVTITKDFYIGVFEVTQRQRELVMGNRPSLFSNETCYATRPVSDISYLDLRGSCAGVSAPRGIQVDDGSFLSALRARSGIGGFDLATGAQMEYVCRAGSQTALNNGRNIDSLSDPGVLNEISRNCYNSGWLENHQDSAWRAALYSADDSVGTARVGSYASNDWGLYDMHGNVWEYCFDCLPYGDLRSIDPIATNVSCVAFYGASFEQTGLMIYNAHWGSECIPYVWQGQRNVGFRLCLQGGDIPDLAAATTLVNESGAGSQSWSPTRSGAYYLTHSAMNGTTNVQLASAWFEVPGCTLTLEPQGELTNGVNVAIGGVDGGWTVYYTTDGSEPTTNSTVYAGAFALSESATVRAVAYNAQGIASEETMTTFTLHDALSVVGAVARQRYPWNGMVDVDLELKGDPEAKYQVGVEAKDLDGGTNLPVKTVFMGGPRSVAAVGGGADATERVPPLAPGSYRLTWNADADIAADGEFPRVAVLVKATRQSAIAAYARSLTISTDGYAGSETLTNVPVLVRLSTNITGFAYSDFASPTNGADLAFFDANENELPYEIDEWHTNGESLVWVKLPTLVKGTTFTCAYGNVDAFVSNASDKDGSSSSDAIGTIASTERSRMKHEVWCEYAGVWHMNEDSGTAYDSTEHGLDALPSCGTNKLADVSQMVAYENGACGRARVNATKTHISCGNYMLTPSYSGLGIKDEFVVSGWFFSEIPTRADAMIGRIHNNVVGGHGHSSKGEWHIETRGVAGEEYVVCGATNHTGYVISSCDSYSNNWAWIAVAYSGTNVSCYSNGKLVKTGKIIAATDNGLPISLGCPANGDGGSFTGQYDEIRLRGGLLSADRIKADYDMIANRKFCTYGAVKKGAE